jgi:hypothetical protein
MAYKTGLRFLAALFCLTGIGLPIGLLLWHKARKAEKEIEQARQCT